MVLQTMRKAFEIVAFVVFTLASIYVGGYLMFFGGIVQMIESAKVDPMNVSEFAIGLLKFMFGGFVGYIIFMVGLLVSSFRQANWGNNRLFNPIDRGE